MTGPGAGHRAEPIGGAEPSTDAAGSVEEILALFDRFAGGRYDEEVSQLDHALQTASRATAEGATDPLVAAALLHDVGHLLALRYGAAADGRTDVDPRHEARGARWLARVLPPSVTGPIALHVAAKRYRCAVDPDYHDALSAGSRRSLVRQGGPMARDEVARFEANPAHHDALRLRAWDDGGKRTDGIEVAPLAAYRSILDGLASA